MNINMLRDADDGLDIRAAGCAADPLAVWRGATLFMSTDGGASYSSIGALTTEATMGVTVTALGDFAGGNIVDELNVLRVRMSNGALSSTDNAGLLAGTNMAIVGDEILFFRDAVLNGDGSYTVSGFLRGRRGSEYAMAGHAIGERFILVNSAMLRVLQDTSAIGTTRHFKLVADGGSLASATAQTFTNEGTPLKPYAPVQLGGGRDASNNLTLNWTRRNRMDGGWRDLVDVPMSEATESYVVRIYADGTYATVKRTIEGIATPITAYSAADQAADFGSAQATVYWDVRQLSAVVGPGHAARGST